MCIYGQPMRNEEGSPSQPPTSRDLTFFVEVASTAGATTIDRHGLPKLCSPPLNSKAKIEEGSEIIALLVSRFVKSTVRRSVWASDGRFMSLGAGELTRHVSRARLP